MRSEFYPLGFPLWLETDSAEVIDAAGESWGAFQKAFAAEALELRVIVGGGAKRPPTPVFRSEGSVFAFVSDPANFGFCEMRRGQGCAWLSAGAVADRSWLRYHFLDGMVYKLLDSVYLSPVHASCIALDGRGVLLCGDREAGKSSLAYACARAGWTFITDDAVHILDGRRRTAVGNPHQLRLREQAKTLFPELSGIPATLRANGKMTLEVFTATLDGVRTAPCCKVECLVFLQRQPGNAELKAFDRESVLSWMRRTCPCSDDEIAARQEEQLRDLLAGADVLELSYPNPAAAVERLSALVRSGN